MMLMACLVVLGGGCGSQARTIRVPEDIVKPPGEEEVPRPAERPYVIKMSDGRRTWQIELPAGPGAPAFEASIPLGVAVEEAPSLPLTEADREILDAKRSSGEAVLRPSERSGGASGGEPPSYLRTLARVRELYRARQFELALVELVRLERSFPDDIRILEMKGTLLSRLGRPDEARAAWERVLALEPDNRVVLRALEALADRGE